MKNEKKYLIFNCLVTTAQLLYTGAVVQNFLLYIGLSAGQVSVYTSVLQIAQVGAMFPLCFFGDKVKRVRTLIASILYFLPIVFLSFLFIASPILKTVQAKYVIALIVGAIVYLAYGVYNVFCYKLPYYIIDMQKYGKLASIGGMISGALGIFITFLMNTLVEHFDYLAVTCSFFVLGAVLYIVSATFCFRFKLHKPHFANESQQEVSFKELFKLPVFYKLVPAHILRGIGNGIITLVVVIGTDVGILDTKTAVTAAFLYSVATVVGYFVYTFTEDKLGANGLLFLSGALTAVSAPFCVCFGNLYLFFVFYAINNICNIVYGMAVPVIVTKIVPFEMMGKYTSARMLLFTFGSALPGFFMGGLLKLVGGTLTLLIGGIFLLSSCILYALVAKKHKIELPTIEE